jgi:hypothetical protein
MIIPITVMTRVTGTRKATSEVAVAVAIEDGVNVEVDAAVILEDITTMVMLTWPHLPGKKYAPIFRRFTIYAANTTRS